MKSGRSHIDTLAAFLLIAGFLYGIALIWLKLTFPSGFCGKVLFIRLSFHELDRPLFIALSLILIGLFLRIRNLHVPITTRGAFTIGTIFFLTIATLKVLQYRFYVSSAFDLGIRANILHNLIRHGRVWDSLTGRHGFSGHFWPAAYPLSLLFLLWEDPRILLILQSLAIAAVIPILHGVLESRGAGRYSLPVLLLYMVNYYVHRVSAFDFHPEALGIPLVLLSLYFFEKNRDIPASLLLISTYALKEDMAIMGLSVSLFLFFTLGKKKLAVHLALFSILYFALSLWMIERFGNLGTRFETHYGGNAFAIEKFWVPIRFFGAFGFLPLLKIRDLTLIILPFLEHISSSYRPNYLLISQYSAALLPGIFYLIVRNLSEKNCKLLQLGIALSLLAYPFYYYLPPSKVSLRKSRYIDALLKKIPPGSRLSAGNHVAAHAATRDGTVLFPLFYDADFIVVDTTWKSYQPLSYREGRKVLEEILNDPDYEVISDSFGVLFIARRPKSGLSGEAHPEGRRANRVRLLGRPPAGVSSPAR